jgi:hypothetical protein
MPACGAMSTAAYCLVLAACAVVFISAYLTAHTNL